jgi:hypothetical protein
MLFTEPFARRTPFDSYHHPIADEAAGGEI